MAVVRNLPTMRLRAFTVIDDEVEIGVQYGMQMIGRAKDLPLEDQVAHVAGAVMDRLGRVVYLYDDPFTYRAYNRAVSAIVLKVLGGTHDRGPRTAVLLHMALVASLDERGAIEGEGP